MDISFLIYIPSVPAKDEDERVYGISGENASDRALSVLELCKKQNPDASLWVKVQC